MNLQQCYRISFQTFKANLVRWQQSLSQKWALLNSPSQSLKVSPSEFKESFLRATRFVHLPQPQQIQVLYQQLNQITGYDAIVILKDKVTHLETSFTSARTMLQASQQRYQKAVSSRSQCQRDINGLLQRKHTWTPADVLTFTSLHQQEMDLAKEETLARTEYQHAEDAVNDAQRDLMGAIRQRYHEEQTWSDKIRRASTYGTLLIMGGNVFLFLVSILWWEPKRRATLVNKMEVVVVEEVERVAEELKSKLGLEIQQLQTNFETALKDSKEKNQTSPHPVVLPKEDTSPKVLQEKLVNELLQPPSQLPESSLNWPTLASTFLGGLALGSVLSGFFRASSP